MEDSEVYRSVGRRLLDEAARSIQEMEGVSIRQGRFVEAFLAHHVGQTGQLEGIQHVALLLDPPTKPPKPSLPAKRSKRLSNRERKTLGLHRIPKQEQKYSLYEPLHQLWVGYMTELLQPSSHSSPMQLAQKVLKADLHGCLVRVTRARCASLTGSEGIVLQETQNTLQLISKEDRVKTIPKAGCVFEFSVCGHQFTLYGSNMRYRAADRSARKFKDRPSIDL